MQKFYNFLLSFSKGSHSILIESMVEAYRACFESLSPISVLDAKNEDYLYLMNIGEDAFVHFSKAERIDEILKSGKILKNPPYSKFGPDSIFAVSTIWGRLVTGIQLTHIYNDDKVNEHIKDGSIAAIYFKTDTLPKIGYPEEVLWDQDVNLIDPKRISAEEGIKLISNTAERNKMQRGSNSQVVYKVPEQIWGTPLKQTAMESLSTDSANAQPNGNRSNPIVPMTAPILPGRPDKDEYFPETLSSAKREQVEQSKFGLGRISKYPTPGRDISPNDAISGNIGAIQNTTGGLDS